MHYPIETHIEGVKIYASKKYQPFVVELMAIAKDCCAAKGKPLFIFPDYSFKVPRGAGEAERVGLCLETEVDGEQGILLAVPTRIYSKKKLHTMAHEVGHLVLGHPWAGQEPSLEHEIAADKWAFSKFLGWCLALSPAIHKQIEFNMEIYNNKEGAESQ